jgi:hypothetical protein
MCFFFGAIRFQAITNGSEIVPRHRGCFLHKLDTPILWGDWHTHLLGSGWSFYCQTSVVQEQNAQDLHVEPAINMNRGRVQQ